MTEMEPGSDAQTETDDEADVRRAVEGLRPGWPDWECVRIVKTTRIGSIALRIVWEEDYPPPSDDIVRGWPEEARAVHESGECAYMRCVVHALCGHLFGRHEEGQIQVAEGGGDDTVRIEREVAEQAILSLMTGEDED